jgi:hypothetical protein
MADAWVEESAGGLLSSENSAIGVPTSLSDREGHICHCAIASDDRTLRSLRTWHAWMPHARESGGPVSVPHFKLEWETPGKKKTPGAWMLARHRCKPIMGTQTPSIREGWAVEGEMPYERLIMQIGSQTQHSTVEADEQGEISTSAESVEGRT